MGGLRSMSIICKIDNNDNNNNNSDSNNDNDKNYNNDRYWLR